MQTPTGSNGGVFMMPSLGSEEFVASELKKALQEHRQHLDNSLEGFQAQHEGLLQRQEELLAQLLDRVGASQAGDSLLSPVSPSSGGGDSPTSEAALEAQRVGMASSTSATSLGSKGLSPKESPVSIASKLPNEDYVGGNAGASSRDWSSPRISEREEMHSGGRQRNKRPPSRGPKARTSRAHAMKKRGAVSAITQEDPYEPAQRAILGMAEKPYLKRKVQDRLDSWHLPESWKRFLARADGPFSGLIKRKAFILPANLLILSNVVFIGAQAQHQVMQAQLGLAPLQAYMLADTVFTVLFALELLMRLIGERAAFFIERDWKWNVMDLILVSMDSFNEILALLMREGNIGFLSAAGTVQGTARTLRLLRAVRAFRALRVLVRMKQVRQMVQELVGSIMPMVWCLVLLAVVLLFFGLIFMQAAADSLQGGVSSRASGDLLSRFGSLELAALSLFKVFTGGVEWEPLHNSLAEVSTFYGICFVVYVSVVVLAFVNIVAATFTLSAMRTMSAKEAEDAVGASREVTKMMQDFGCLQNGDTVQLEDLVDLLEVPQVKDYLSSVNLDGVSVRAIFDLLDLHGHKGVCAADLAQGCAKFARAVRGSDFISVVLATRVLSTQVQNLSSSLDLRLANLEEAL